MEWHQLSNFVVVRRCVIPEHDIAAIKSAVIISRVARKVAEKFQRKLQIFRRQPVYWRQIPMCVNFIVERPALAVRLDLSFRSVYFLFFSPGISSQPLNLSQQKFAR